MKKVIFIIAGAMFTLTTMAQTTPATPTQKQVDSRELRKDIRETRADKRELKADVKARDKGAAKAEIKEIKADRKEMHQDAKTLKAEGVNHPVKRAHKQIHAINKHHK